MNPPMPLEEAQARLLALARPTPVEHVDVSGALGHFLASPLLARRTQPACDLSAMDGYAVGASDLVGPWRVVGESAAGHPWCQTVAPGEAVRIATGALVPDGAGAVVLQEDVFRSGASLTLSGKAPSPADNHIRRAGMDFTTGAELLPTGTRIGPAQAALTIAGGNRHVAVRRPPRLAIIDSGDELSADCETCAPHQIPASNGPMLAALASALPCRIDRLGPVADSLAALAKAFSAAEDADLIVTSGGASVGDHDLIRPAMAEWGAEIAFWRVAIKPGKPLLVAKRGHQILLGLPGNPVSSYVTSLLFLLPLLRAMLGAAEPLPRRIAARLGTGMPATGPRREFVRGVWDGETVNPLSLQDSGALSALALSNALIERPAGAALAAIGEPVSLILHGNSGTA